MNYLEKIKKDFISDDLLIKKIIINNNIIYFINIETITNNNLYNLIINNLSYLNNLNNLLNYFYNIPNIKIINNYKELKTLLLNSYTIIIINNNILGLETKNNLIRSISTVEYEKTINGPKESFIEDYNTNIGLIRKRIKNNNLSIKSFIIGKYTNTKIGIVYINKVSSKELVNKISKKLNKINSDIIDCNYLKKYLNNSNNFFPNLKTTERPDAATLSLLKGKVLIVVDNSPEVLILPTYFIDFFHTIDDYYQKKINISFIRIIRLIAFLIGIFIPSIYIAITTHNPDCLPINLLLSLKNQRVSVPFPAFFEAILMIITFEILRESDIRIPSTMGTSISILGGLILGEACVNAGILSPIMIVVIAISAISGMLFNQVEAINAIRWYRFILIILATFLGFFGIFLGIIFILSNLSDTKNINNNYLYPFTPINLKELKNSFIKLNNKRNL